MSDSTPPPRYDRQVQPVMTVRRAGYAPGVPTNTRHHLLPMHGRTHQRSHTSPHLLLIASHIPSHHWALSPLHTSFPPKLSYSMTGACKSRETATLYLQQLTQTRGGEGKLEKQEKEGERIGSGCRLSPDLPRAQLLCRARA